METITPSIAKELMTLNKCNRPLNKKTVSWYANQMRKGQWTISGQTISISDKNVILDGQHRLAAIIESGISINFLIAYNVPQESFVNYDNMKSRGMSDVFAVDGILNYNCIAAIISKYNSLILGHDSSMGFGMTNSSRGAGVDKSIAKFTNKESVNLYYENDRLLQEIHQVSYRCYTKIRLFTSSQIGSIMFYLIKDKHYGEEYVFSFFKQLFFNEDITNISIYNLREKLIKDSVGHYRMIGKVKFAYLIKCWNAYVLNKQIKLYTFDIEKEQMPNFI